MRILHVITTLDTGGAERLIVDLLPRLKEMGHQVDLLVFNGAATPFREDLEQKGVTIHELTNVSGNPRHTEVYNPLNIIKLRRYLDKYDIIHTHNTACQLYVPLASIFSRKHALLVTTEHNATNRRRSIKWFRPIDRWMYNRYAAIICIAEQTRANLEKYIGKKSSICTINNGVNIGNFIRPIKYVDRQEGYVITMVAGFRQQKDHETILRAFKHLPHHYRLQLVGYGPLYEHVKEMCREMGLEDQVQFMGVRLDVPDILEQSDIVVLSSHWEGLSLSSIEGMASGRPFIASNVDGLRDIVGGAGVLFPHGNDKALAEAIMKLCENPAYYRQVAMACQERARKYDISVMAELYLKLYESLVPKLKGR